MDEQTIADWQDAIRGLGRIVWTGSAEGVPLARAEMFGGDFRGGWNAARFLCRLAESDARRPEVQILAVEAASLVRAQGGSREDLARALHAFVQSRVRFAREPGERFQGTMFTLSRGLGDCDDSARALYALARAAGLPARLAFLTQAGEPAHVFCLLGSEGKYVPAETTIAAAFGEHPIAACKRLGVKLRPDLSGKVKVFMGSLGQSLVVSSGSNVDPSFAVRHGMRVRLLVDVPLLETPEALADLFHTIGFSPVAIVLDRSQLTLTDWPSDWLSVAAGADSNQALAWVDGVYQGDASALSRDLGDGAHVRDAVEVIGEGSPADTQGSASAPSAPSGPAMAPIDPTTLPPIPPDPADVHVVRSPWAAIVLRHAWVKAFGSAPYNQAAEQGILAIADLETGLGRSVWSDPFDANGYSLRYNFGNLHAGIDPVAGFCPVGSKPHGDATGTGKAYVTCFQAYKTALDGMVAFLKVLCGEGRENTRAALLSGDATAIASAMRTHGYYGFDATDAQRDTYAKAIESHAATVADKLNEPIQCARGGPPSGTAGIVALAVLSAVTALASFFAMKGA